MNSWLIILRVNSKISSDKNYNKNYDKDINISDIKNVKSKRHELIDYKFIYYEKKIINKKSNIW